MGKLSVEETNAVTRRGGVVCFICGGEVILQKGKRFQTCAGARVHPGCATCPVCHERVRPDVPGPFTVIGEHAYHIPCAVEQRRR